ncbi:response regulator [Serpentinicella sp. ANB-PHB4]|uniref:response regulator n=1 Tax=Serpentinicella sp. ANB-PHB4 TaxID=3074076 RepID=UPI002F3F9B0C
MSDNIRPKVLIVDDAAFMRATLSALFTENGFEVVGEAANGIEAVREYKSLSPDLVTMDITMPKMDGIEAIQALVSYNQSVNIIVCSARGFEDAVVEAVQAGAKGFIVKPIDTERLIEEAKKILGIKTVVKEDTPSNEKQSRQPEDKKNPRAETAQMEPVSEMDIAKKEPTTNYSSEVSNNEPPQDDNKEA